jgi:flagellar assembly protein FliH
MSLEAAFSPLDFPAIAGERTDERASIRGHAAGYAAGRKQVEEELAVLREAIELDGRRRSEAARTEVQLALDALARSAEEFRRRELPLLQHLDAAITAAALEIAEVIVGRELDSTEGSARVALGRVTQEAGPGTSIVRLNPEDIAVIAEEAAPGAGVDLVPDSALERGDAIIELSEGSIDARVARSIERARAALRGGAM